jgi:hypothetical protein
MTISLFTKKLLSLSLTATAAVVGVVSGIVPVHAYTIFFGEDLGLGESTRLPATPNANAAEANFLSNLAGVGTEDFESFAPGAGTPLNVTFPGSITTNITATISGVGSIDNVPSGTNGVGRYPISGDQYLETNSEFLINFDQEVAAFGFYGIDIGDFDGQITLTLTDGNSTTLTIPNTTSGLGGSVLFYGIIADNDNEVFTDVSFGNTASGVDFFGFDDLTVGDIEQVGGVVPEPASTLALLVLGTLGAGSALKRKRN